MAASGGNLQLFRGILREVRHMKAKPSLKNDAMYNFVVDQFRRHQVTSQKICRGDNEMQHLGQTYLCYLESVRKHEELSQKFKGKGERSVEESANLVGLTLPKSKTEE